MPWRGPSGTRRRGSGPCTGSRRLRPWGGYVAERLQCPTTTFLCDVRRAEPFGPPAETLDPDPSLGEQVGFAPGGGDVLEVRPPVGVFGLAHDVERHSICA